MNVCKRCGKENHAHYRFCLGCGGELTRDQGAADAASAPGSPAPPDGGAQGSAPSTGTAEIHKPKGAASPGTARLHKQGNSPPETPQASGGAGATAAPASAEDASVTAAPTQATDKAHGPVSQDQAPVGRRDSSSGIVYSYGAHEAPPDEPPAPAPPSQEPPVVAPPPGACPKCGHPVPEGFRFCGACGERLDQAPTPAGKTMFLAPGAGAAPAPRGKLVLIRPDGSEGEALPLTEGETLVGRGQGAMFDGDAYLSPRHAQLVVNAAGLVVRDLHSLNGVFLKLTDEEEIDSGTVFRIGQELLRFDAIQPPVALEDGTEVMGSPNPGFWGRLVVIVSRDVDGSAFPLFGDAVVLGRERGDILFPEDGYVSGTHARISYRDGAILLADLGSSNGTFLQVQGERPVPAGSFLLMGQQLFRVEIS